jgi:hypothetical protein
MSMARLDSRANRIEGKRESRMQPMELLMNDAKTRTFRENPSEGASPADDGETRGVVCREDGHIVAVIRKDVVDRMTEQILNSSDFQSRCQIIGLIVHPTYKEIHLRVDEPITKFYS